jgi:Peptidase family S41
MALLRYPYLSGAAGALLGLVGSPALAGDFAEDGTFIFDADAAVALDFEEDPGPGRGPGDAEPPLTAPDDGALSGARVVVLTPFQGIDLPITLPAAAQTYRASVWIRGAEAVVDLSISYSDRTDEVSALYPTGRITSDGWVELANDHLRVDGARITQATVGVFSPGDAVVDAVEIVADGGLGAMVSEPNPRCDGVTDASACAADQVCMWSECRNVNGWVPPIPEDREAVTRYLEGRLALLFGPYRERAVDLPASLVAIEQMRAATDRWTYWNGFMLAVRRLHDGHTSTSGLADLVLRNRRPLAVCFLEGDADLSHDVAPADPRYLDVLVSHTGGDHTLGLRRGDRLVRVDGQHPIAWARSLIAVHWSQPAVSNHTTFAEHASRLRGLIGRYAHSLEVVRCDPVSGACGELEEISITDLPPDPPGTPVDSVACDNRPLRHLPSSPADHDGAGSDSVYSGVINESDAVEKIYGLEWESLYTTTGNDGVGSALKSAVSTWKTQGARGVILDHRKGTGGTLLAPRILWDYAVPRHASDIYVDRIRAEDEQPTLAEGAAFFADALSSGQVDYAGSNNPEIDVPVALLVTEDVSASDWLPLGMKGAPKVRIFGPFQTNGAFSTLYSFGYWLGMSYSIAVGDTFVADGRTLNGRGIDPDVIVLPKQSDLLVGKDTVFEAALDWVRQELAP